MSFTQPIQVNTLTFDAKQSWWRRAGSDTELELVIAGNEGGPSPQAIAIAEEVLPDVSRFKSQAVDYLKMKLLGADALRDNSWHLEWVEFGIGQRLDFQEFELFMSESRDTYALWRVRFRKKTGRFVPISVTRADW